MPKPYDHVQKFVVATTPTALAQMFLGWQPTHVETLNVELPDYSNRTVDNLFRVTLPDRERPVLLQIEWFTYNDPELPLRNLRYYLDIKLKCDPKNEQELIQLVLYSGTKPLRMESTFTSSTVNYSYMLVDLREIPYEAFLQTGTPELMLLAILGKMDDTDHAVKEILERLAELLEGNQARLSDYLQHVGTLARLRPKTVHRVKQLIEAMGIYVHLDRRSDPYYRAGLKKGAEKGFDKGLLKGKLEGLNEGLLKGKLDTARRLFRKRVAFELVQDATQLDTETLLKLQAEAGS